MEELNLVIWYDDLFDWDSVDMFISMLKTETVKVKRRLKTGVEVSIYQYQYDKLTP